MSQLSEARKFRSLPLAVDLFCGVGGMSLGFEQAGFQVAAALDSNPKCVETHKVNFPAVTTILADVTTTTGADIRRMAKLGQRRVAVVFGGPPCQGFSIGGKMAPEDERNQLLLEFARLAVDLEPSYFVLENVRGLMEPRYSSLLATFEKRVRRAGYSIVQPLRTLDASLFGVPQRRKRVFVLGHRRDLPAPRYPTLPANGYRSPTVWDAIGDLAVVEGHDLVDGDKYGGELGPASEYAKALRADWNPELDPLTGKTNGVRLLSGFRRTAHTPGTIERFSSVPQGRAEPTSRFIRLSQAGLSSTLRAGTAADRGSFMAPRPIHPVFHRCICVREAARLHSFPDSFTFHEAKWHAFMQIGNSVPPLLARAVALEIARVVRL